jgi:hypothetical protein
MAQKVLIEEIALGGAVVVLKLGQRRSSVAKEPV